MILAKEYYVKEGTFLAHKPHKRLHQGYVYLIWFSDTNTYKIGMTKDIERRLKEYSQRDPNRESFKLIHLIETNQCHELEMYLHKKFASKKLEDFSEEFDLSKEDIDIITSTVRVDYKTTELIDNRTKEEKDKAEYEYMGEEWYRHLYECGDVDYYDWCKEFMDE